MELSSRRFAAELWASVQEVKRRTAHSTPSIVPPAYECLSKLDKRISPVHFFMYPAVRDGTTNRRTS